MSILITGKDSDLVDEAVLLRVDGSVGKVIEWEDWYELDAKYVVLPPHGRLVDADRLRVILCRLLDRQTDEIAKHTVRWIIQILDKLETVVEGEDENDDQR